MRVLMLGWEFPPWISGGLGTACHGLVRGLAGRGVEVTFVLPRAPGASPSFVELVGCEDEPAGVETVPLASALRPYQSAREYAAAGGGAYGGDLMDEVERYARAAAALGSGRSFDLVHAHDWMTYPAGLALAASSGRPLVCHLHASEVDRAGPSGDARIHAIEQRGFDGADRVVCVSRYTADVVRRHYAVDEGKLAVVHNAVERSEPLARSERRRRLRGPVVLFLGRVTFQKGPGYFLEAAARVLALEPRVKFVVCGDGDLWPAVVERAAELGIARAVHFTGFLRGDEVRRAYALADVYVMPSVSEPFGIAPLEALALDVPVLVSRQSGVREVLQSGLAFDYWDVDDLARKILALVRKPRLRRRLARRGRAELEGLRWEDRARRMIEVYEEVLA